MSDALDKAADLVEEHGVPPPTAVNRVAAELCGTSLWFSGNNAIAELASLWELTGPARAWLLMAVQLGFIAGTLGLAASGLADALVRSHTPFDVIDDVSILREEQQVPRADAIELRR